MLLSTFSHFSLFHMAANMYVLWSFSSSIVNILGQEQFMAVYLSAGNQLSSWACPEFKCSHLSGDGTKGMIIATFYSNPQYIFVSQIVYREGYKLVQYLSMSFLSPKALVSLAQAHHFIDEWFSDFSAALIMWIFVK